MLKLKGIKKKKKINLDNIQKIKYLKTTNKKKKIEKIPKPISNWKNPKGFTIPIDTRLSNMGYETIKKTLNDKFLSFSNVLDIAEKHINLNYK